MPEAAIDYLRWTPLVCLTRAGGRRAMLGYWRVRFADAYLLEMEDLIETTREGRPIRLEPRATDASVR